MIWRREKTTPGSLASRLRILNSDGVSVTFVPPHRDGVVDEVDADRADGALRLVGRRDRAHAAAAAPGRGRSARPPRTAWSCSRRRRPRAPRAGRARVSRAVSMMIGTALWARMRLHASVPESRGSITSSTIRSTASERAIDTACAPSIATSTSKPLALEGVLQAPHDRRLVVDDQDARAHAACLRRSQRQPNPHGRADPGLDSSSISPPRTRTVSRAIDSPSPKPAARPAGPVEPVEDPRLLAIRDPAARVRDLDHRAGPVLAAAEGDRAGRRVLGGVQRQVRSACSTRSAFAASSRSRGQSTSRSRRRPAAGSAPRDRRARRAARRPWTATASSPRSERATRSRARVKPGEARRLSLDQLEELVAHRRGSFFAPVCSISIAVTIAASGVRSSCAAFVANSRCDRSSRSRCGLVRDDQDRRVRLDRRRDPRDHQDAAVAQASSSAASAPRTRRAPRRTSASAAAPSTASRRMPGVTYSRPRSFTNSTVRSRSTRITASVSRPRSRSSRCRSSSSARK